MTAGLASTLADLPVGARRTGPKCSVAKLIDTIAATDPATADALVAAIDGPSSTTQIGDALVEHGYQITVWPLQRHRRRGASNGCRCPR